MQDLYLMSYVQPSGLLVRLAWGRDQDGGYYCERRIDDPAMVQAGCYGWQDGASVQGAVAEWERFEQAIGSVAAI